MNRTLIATLLLLCTAVAPSFAQSAHTVRIGFAAPLSGPLARYGQDAQNGAAMAIKDINAKKPSIGGRKVKFELVAVDDGADALQALTAARSLCSKKVAGVVGHLGSYTTIAATPAYRECGIPVVTPSATAPNVVSVKDTDVWRVAANDITLAVATATYAADRLGLKSVAIVHGRPPESRDLANLFREAATLRGMGIVDEYTLAEMGHDWPATLLFALMNAPDAIFFDGSDQQTAALLKEMDRMDMGNTWILTSDGVCTPALQEQAGAGKAINRLVCIEPGVALNKMPGGQAWYQRYNALYPNAYLQYSPYVYDGVMVIYEAMRATQSADPRKYRNALSKLRYKGITANIAFEAEGGNLQNPQVTISTYRNGNKTAMN